VSRLPVASGHLVRVALRADALANVSAVDAVSYATTHMYARASPRKTLRPAIWDARPGPGTRLTGQEAARV
jgi:hypothetical protein